MKVSLWMCGLLTVAALSGSAIAQAPAGATGQCKDGTYSTAASKDGACRGHKGVQAWYSQTPAGASKAASSTSQKSASVPASAPTPAAAAPARPQAAPAQPAPTPSAAAPAQTAPAPQSTAAGKSPRASTASTAQAPGGGPGLVWVNTNSKVYHCAGTAFYGKTKAGKYVTEDAAKAEGDRADNNKPCTK